MSAQARPGWSRQLSLVWVVAGVVMVVIALIARDWFFALFVALIVAGGALHLRRTRPAAAAQERAEQDAQAAAGWPPARVRAVAGERGLDLTDDRDRVTVIAALRREEPRLSLLTAKRLV